MRLFKKASAPLLAVILLFFGLFFSPLFSGCASRSSPSGGAKDTTTAKLDTSFPANNTVFFKAQEIELIFNEYIKLKGAQQQITISPPLAEPLEISAGAKNVIIKLNDSLRANTTYIISFGEAISDFTEGNVTQNLKYVFSTGSYIDSLQISGSVKQAYTNSPDEELLVALFNEAQIKKPDSFLYQQLPNYYANLTEAGTFEMTNLKAGRYRLVAFADKSRSFKLKTGKERFAFWPQTIDIKPDSMYNYKLKSYEPKPVFRFYNARHKARGKVVFAFSAAADSFNIEPVNISSDSSFFKPNPNNDTIVFWFNAQADSAVFKLNGRGFSDSIITVPLRKYRKITLRIKPSKTDLRVKDTLVLNSNFPLTGFVADSVLLEAKDTTIVALSIDTADPFKAYLLPPFKTDFSLNLKAGAPQAWFNPKLDSTTYQFKIFNNEDLGTLNFTVKADSGYNYLLTLYTEEGTLLKKQSFTDSTLVSLKNYIPGKFKAYLVQDLDSNQAYTPGNYALRRLPEARIAYKETIEVRANWELDLVWQVKGLGY